MLLPARIAQGVRQGSITLAYRRWEQPRVRVGGTQLTSAGIVRFDEVRGGHRPGHHHRRRRESAGFADADAAARLSRRNGP